MKKVMLIYPPGELYQRGEERCQGNIKSSTASSIRAANDLGYAASSLKKKGHKVFLKDYQTEGLRFQVLLDDALAFAPDFLFVSITNSTIFADLKVVNRLKKALPDLVVILKGALFFQPSEELLNELDLGSVRYLIGGESEFTLSEVIEAHGKGADESFKSINALTFKSFSDSVWLSTSFDKWEANLDQLSYPDRTLLNNSLYVRPDTGEPQATIVTSRGCSAACVYCLTPVISGKKIRFRTPEDILGELRECYNKYGIKNFFFRSDTFTMNRKWVEELCQKIIDSELNGKIEWVANSRVNPLELETLKIMKKAGCWLVAFGFESGHPETLLKARKGAKVEDNLRAAQLVREAGLKLFGFFMVGFPWESSEHLEATRNHMFEIGSDFVELHIATPYIGTELHEIAESYGVLEDSPLGKNYFDQPTIGTKYLSKDELQNFRRETLFSYHLRMSYIGKRLRESITKPKVLKNYFEYGWQVLKNNRRVHEKSSYNH